MIGTCPLGSVIDVSTGQPAPKSSEFGDEGKPFIRAGSLENLLNGGTLADCEKVSEQTATNRRLRLYPKDTIVFAKSGMSATLGRIYRLPEPAHVVSHLATLVPTGEYNPTFLMYWLRRNPPSHLVRDPAYPSIRVGDIEGIEVPDISLERQQKIATTLDKADSIRRKREQALTLTDKLLRSAFLNMFGDPVLNTKGFPMVALGEIIKVSSGKGLTKKHMNLDGRYPVYGANGISGYHSKYMFEKSQIVIGRVGTCGAIHVSKPRAWITDNALYIREYKQPVNQTYLEWALKFANLNQYAEQATHPLISGNRIYPIEIILPDEDSQVKFSSLAKQQGILLEKLSGTIGETEDFFQSLSQRAFRGEL